MTTGSAKSQDILSQMEGLGGKRKGENLIGSGFPKLSLYKKHETQSEILVLAPQKMLHKPQWGALCHRKNKNVFTFSNLTEVNTEPINWHTQPVLVHHFLLFNPNAFTFSCRTVFHFIWSLQESSSYFPVPHIWAYTTLWRVSPGARQQ